MPTKARLADARAKLFARRETRIRPATDDKVLADWNGLMIAALAFAGATFNRPDWIAAADTAFNVRHRHDDPRRTPRPCLAGRQGSRTRASPPTTPR